MALRSLWASRRSGIDADRPCGFCRGAIGVGLGSVCKGRVRTLVVGDHHPDRQVHQAGDVIRPCDTFGWIQNAGLRAMLCCDTGNGKEIAFGIDEDLIDRARWVNWSPLPMNFVAARISISAGGLRTMNPHVVRKLAVECGDRGRSVAEF